MTGPSRQPINIDPKIRSALRAHLMSPKYMGTGVGYSEFIRRALVRDGALNIPKHVQADNRWGGTYFPDDLTNGNTHGDGPNSLPDPIVEVVGLGDGTMNVKTASGMRWHLTEAEYLAWPRTGGSLTATEPPDDSDPIADRMLLNSRLTMALDRSPRGVTPALDVERLAEAIFEAGVRQTMRQSEESARNIAAEYARLGSPENSK